VVTKTVYNDPFDRPTLVNYALGTAIQNETSAIYAPTSKLSGNDSIILRDKDNLHDGYLQTFIHTDGLGRTIKEWTLNDPEGNVEVETRYDALGRVYQKSDPFRPSAGESAAYVTTLYDLAGRVIQINYPDGSVAYNTYQANVVLATDQAGKQRLTRTDALGRLADVTEDPYGLNYFTSYSYDPLDNLL
jgi:hypothetical protein